MADALFDREMELLKKMTPAQRKAQMQRELEMTRQEKPSTPEEAAKRSDQYKRAWADSSDDA